VEPRPLGPGNLPTVTTYGLPNVDNVVATANFSSFAYNDGVLTWTTPVPEPGTYALMFAGLAVVGFMARRRRRG